MDHIKMSLNKKYGFTGEEVSFDGSKLKRIVALKEFGDVSIGTIGGWIENETNLSQTGDCWVYQDACVYQNAMLIENSKVLKNSEIKGNVIVGENSIVDKSTIFGNVEDIPIKILGNTKIKSSSLKGEIETNDNAIIRSSYVLGNNILIQGKIINGVNLIGDDIYIFGCINGKITIDSKSYIGSTGSLCVPYSVKINLYNAKVISPSDILVLYSNYLSVVEGVNIIYKNKENEFRVINPLKNDYVEISFDEYYKLIENQNKNNLKYFESFKRDVKKILNRRKYDKEL